MRIYGDGALPITLIEDDGVSYAYRQGAYNLLTLAWVPSQQRRTHGHRANRPGVCGDGVAGDVKEGRNRVV